MNGLKRRIVSAGHFGWFFMALGFGVLTSCGGDDTTNNGSTGAGGGGGGTAGTGSGGAGGGGMMVNGCDPTTAVDKTASATTSVAFSDTTLVYDPACIRIKVGSSVSWSGNFVAHPLEGGTINGITKTPDPTSPIKLTMGMDAGSVTFPFPNAGNFPYYCTIHGTIGMKGAVFVVP
jgi:plastocyanin